MKTVLFTDIDDCFMATEKKFSKDLSLSVASLDIHGQARSFISEKQYALLELFLNSQAMVIPVTGRSYSTLKRIQLNSLLTSWKIVSHGALIIEPNDDKHQPWLDYLNKKFPLAMWFEKLKKINKAANDFITYQNFNAKSYIVSEGDLHCYVCIKCVDGADYQSIFNSILSQASLDLKDIKTHINGRNMAFLPPYTQKQLAVEFLNHHLGDNDKRLTLSMGDSLSDIPFMKQADFALMPTKSQIADSLTW